MAQQPRSPYRARGTTLLRLPPAPMLQPDPKNEKKKSRAKRGGCRGLRATVQRSVVAFVQLAISWGPLFAEYRHCLAPV